MQVRSEMSNAFSNNEGITDNIVSVIDWCNYYEEVSVLTPDDADFENLIYACWRIPKMRRLRPLPKFPESEKATKITDRIRAELKAATMNDMTHSIMFGRIFHRADPSEVGFLSRAAFLDSVRNALQAPGISINTAEGELLAEHYDGHNAIPRSVDGQVCYPAFMRAVRGEMSHARQLMVAESGRLIG